MVDAVPDLRLAVSLVHQPVRNRLEAKRRCAKRAETRQPISEVEMRDLMASQIASLDDDLRPAWQRYGLPSPVQILCVRPTYDGSPPEPEPIFCLARDSDRVLIYDDVEEDFGTGVPDADDVLRDCGTYGEELSWSLRPFVEGH